MQDLLAWLESTSVARMVQESAWGYPIVLSAHAVGMAILAGIVLMMNFRVLGLAPGVPLAALRAMYRYALIGLVINVVTGSMLFVANADAFYDSTPFRLKMLSLVVGITLWMKMSRQTFGLSGPLQGDVTTKNLKLLAAISSIAWISVIVMGRLIAYWDWKDF